MRASLLLLRMKCETCLALVWEHLLLHYTIGRLRSVAAIEKYVPVIIEKLLTSKLNTWKIIIQLETGKELYNKKLSEDHIKVDNIFFNFYVACQTLKC